MMIIAAEVRKEAWEKLKPSYWKIFGMTIIPLLVSFIFNILVSIGGRNQTHGSWIVSFANPRQFLSYASMVLVFFLSAGIAGTLVRFVQAKLAKDFSGPNELLERIKPPYTVPLLLTGIMLLIFTTLWGALFYVSLGVLGVSFFVAAARLGATTTRIGGENYPAISARGTDTFFPELGNIGIIAIIASVLLLLGAALLIYKYVQYSQAVYLTYDIIETQGKLPNATLLLAHPNR